MATGVGALGLHYGESLGLKPRGSSAECSHVEVEHYLREEATQSRRDPRHTTTSLQIAARVSTPQGDQGFVHDELPPTHDRGNGH
jgi:hypothetical protein